MVSVRLAVGHARPQLRRMSLPAIACGHRPAARVQQQVTAILSPGRFPVHPANVQAALDDDAPENAAMCDYS